MVANAPSNVRLRSHCQRNTHLLPRGQRYLSVCEEAACNRVRDPIERYALQNGVKRRRVIGPR